jgi:uncharacterized DUF497 family protein
VATVVYGDFEWDDEKAARNLAKHGIPFEEAAAAAIDPQAVLISDDSDPEEERFQLIGRPWKARLLLVVFVERGERDRIISARRATRAETARYPSGA